MKNYIVKDKKVIEVKTGLVFDRYETVEEAKQAARAMNGGQYGFNGFTPAHLLQHA